MKTKNGGFTLVEILIVVVILGILAAIVIPQFTQASTEAREASLASNLQTIRSQIELFKIQHNDDWPNTTTFLLFETDMCEEDADGFGPYLQQIPINPFNNDNEVTFGAVAGPAGGTGWYVNTADDTFHANDGGSTDALVAHYDF